MRRKVAMGGEMTGNIPPADNGLRQGALLGKDA
jgi:hypothetical protein